jgi:hypothetical protein
MRPTLSRRGSPEPVKFIAVDVKAPMPENDPALAFQSR